MAMGQKENPNGKNAGFGEDLSFYPNVVFSPLGGYPLFLTHSLCLASLVEAFFWGISEANPRVDMGSRRGRFRFPGVASCFEVFLLVRGVLAPNDCFKGQVVPQKTIPLIIFYKEAVLSDGRPGIVLVLVPPRTPLVDLQSRCNVIRGRKRKPPDGREGLGWLQNSLFFRFCWRDGPCLQNLCRHYFC